MCLVAQGRGKDKATVDAKIFTIQTPFSNVVPVYHNTKKEKIKKILLGLFNRNCTFVVTNQKYEIVC